jgi:hypothetical protein
MTRTPSFPYHEPREGFWGEKTVTLNFCEEVKFQTQLPGVRPVADSRVVGLCHELLLRRGLQCELFHTSQ